MTSYTAALELLTPFAAPGGGGEAAAAAGSPAARREAAVLLSNRALARLRMADAGTGPAEGTAGAGAAESDVSLSADEMAALREGALEDAQAAGALCPSNAKAHHRAGAALRALGRDAEAESAFALATQVQAAGPPRWRPGIVALGQRPARRR